jgi:hypothetical protein
MADYRLDTIQGCMQRLTDIDAEIESFRVHAYRDAGALAGVREQWKDRYEVAMAAVQGSNADERKAICRRAVKETAPGLVEKIVELTEAVAAHDRHFDHLDTQRSIVQSCLKTHRELLSPAEQPDSRFGRPLGAVA